MWHSSWDPLFNKYEFDLNSIYNSQLPVYPPREQVFRVFTTPVDKIRLVLLGQDPYHGPDQANGLAFSVQPTTPIPPSLKNIFKELQNEFPERNYTFPSGDLSPWLDQGIFLLNTSLTVELHKPNSHSHLWKEFTDDVITFIANCNPHAIFLLLGNPAKEKAKLIPNKQQIITGVHPSPLSAHRGFFGSNIFQVVEEKLKTEIRWETY